MGFGVIRTSGRGWIALVLFFSLSLGGLTYAETRPSPWYKRADVIGCAAFLTWSLGYATYFYSRELPSEMITVSGGGIAMGAIYFWGLRAKAAKNNLTFSPPKEGEEEPQEP